MHLWIRRLKDGVLLLSMLALGLLIAAKLAEQETGEIFGPFFAIDGDTLEAGRERLRLVGLDAPELWQSCDRKGVAWDCGRQAQDLLEELAGDPRLVCVTSARDRYHRPLVRCSGSKGDAGAIIVARGLAVADGAYAAEQKEAQRNKLGLWSGDFMPPAEWRATHRREEEPALSIADLWAWLMRLIGKDV